MSRRIALSILTAGLLASSSAWARNPHCAGGIQYLTQALADKQKGNMDDYQREIAKAVQQLQQCSGEDPNDLEAMGYLGWALAEVDSSCAAGKAFNTAIDGLKAKNDQKKLDLVLNNRESFWATSFNAGIAKIQAAQQLYNPYTKTPANDDEKKAKDQAKQDYAAAVASLNAALCLKPNDPRTIRNLGAVSEFLGDDSGAEKWFQQGLAAAPKDSDLAAGLKTARLGHANALLDDKKYDEAIAFYQDLLKGEPQNADLWAGIADAAFGKARTMPEGDARVATFKTAADAYAKAADIRTTVPELRYNSGICYQNANDPTDAETQFRAELKLKPEDGDALSSLSTILADQKKFPEAIAMGQKALSLDPKDKDRHRQLGAIYNKAQDNLHSKQALLAFLALDKGSPIDKPTAASGTAGAKVLSSMGKPDQILLWDADGQKYETWFYWTKGQAYHFGGGSQLEKTDWSAALASK